MLSLATKGILGKSKKETVYVTRYVTKYVPQKTIKSIEEKEKKKITLKLINIEKKKEQKEKPTIKILNKNML